MNLEDIWEELEADPAKTRGYLYRRIKPEACCDVLLAVEKFSNTRVLLLKVLTCVMDAMVRFPESVGFEVRPVSRTNGRKGTVTLALILKDARYKDIFTVLAQDVIDHVLLASDHKQVVSTLIARLLRWQAFLKEHSPDGLSEKARQGLYGELWFLRQVVIPQLGFRRGVECWTGPKGTQQDFQFEHCAIEVKTTVAKQHQKLAIASERQLDDTGAGTLILLHLSLDVRQGRGESLPDIVVSVRSLVQNDPLAKEELEALLFEVGYLDIHAPRYEQIGYTEREVNYFKVEGDFPRIVEADLRNGVGDVRYTISVAECRRFSLPEFEVISLISGNS
jgi:hypothetical protein